LFFLFLSHLGRKQEAQRPKDDAAQDKAAHKAAPVPTFGAVEERERG
jgi:hypothetical protein